MFFASGVRATLFGLSLGLPLTIAGLVVLRHTAFGVQMNLTASASIVTIAVMSIASVASWLPSRKAATVDPMLALRSE